MTHAPPDRSCAPGITDLTSLPVVAGNFGLEFMKPCREELSNGVPVYYLHAGHYDILRIELIFKAGHYYQTRNLLAHFTNRMIREGTEDISPYTVAELLDFHGASLLTSCDRDRASVTLYLLDKHAPVLIPLLGHLVREPVFPQQEFEVLRDRQKQEFEISLQKVSHMASRAFAPMIFGETHPYGRKTRTEDYDKLNTVDLRSFHTDYYRPANASVIVVGKITDRIKHMLEEQFGTGAWAPGKVPPSRTFAFQPDEERSAFIPKDDVWQSAVRIGMRCINPRHPDFNGFKVLNTLLGGFFGSRLMKNIREDKGYTYGISSMIIPMEHAGMWVVASEVGAGYSREVTGEVRKEIRRVRDELVAPDELELVKNYLLGAFLRSVDGPFELADKLRDLITFGLGPDNLYQYIEEVKNLTREDLRELAGKYFEDENIYELIVGK